MLTIVKRDNKTFTFTLYDETGAVMDITGCSLFATVKQSVDDLDAAAKIASSLTLSDPTHGQATWSLVPSDTQYLSGPYFMDIELKTAGGLIYTIYKDTFLVLDDITIRTA